MIRLTVPQITDADVAAAADVLRSGWLVQGEKVAAFEAAVGDYVGAPYAVAVSSGTAALHLSLLALGVGPGDAVFVPGFTFPATANVVEAVGARTVLVEVDPGTYCITPEILERALQQWSGPERPRCVVPVHEFGAPCDMPGLAAVAGSFDLEILEDAACALGARLGERHVGTFGRLGCFSWHPRKAITTGEGGMVVTDDGDLARKLGSLRNHGMERTEEGHNDFVAAGLNYRLTDFQAALGIGQLERFEEGLTRRRALAARYLELLDDVPGLQLPDPVPGHPWQTFMVVLPPGVSRQEAIAGLRARGVETNMGAQALHRTTYYRRSYGLPADALPVCSRLHDQGLALPLHAGLGVDQVETVAAELKDFLPS